MRAAVALFASIQAVIAAIDTAVTIAGTKRARRTSGAVGGVTAIHPKAVLIIVMPNKRDVNVAVLSAWGIIVPKT